MEERKIRGDAIISGNLGSLKEDGICGGLSLARIAGKGPSTRAVHHPPQRVLLGISISFRTSTAQGSLYESNTIQYTAVVPPGSHGGERMGPCGLIPMTEMLCEDTDRHGDTHADTLERPAS